MWMFDVDYITRNNSSYVQLLPTLCAFATIVLSYVIYIKRPHRFRVTARMLHETGSCT